jgi:hypothetical protein
VAAAAVGTVGSRPSPIPTDPAQESPELFPDTQSVDTQFGLDCLGCADFGCLAGAKAELKSWLRAMEDDSPAAWEWLFAHELVRQHAFCPHCATDLETLRACTFVAADKRWVCRNKKCRRVKTGNHTVPGQLTMFVLCLWHVSREKRVSEIFASHLVAKETVEAYVEVMCDLAVLINANRCAQAKGTWDRAEWDETWWGQRKFAKGKRVRTDGVLTFCGGVSTVEHADETRSVLDGIIFQVGTKARADVVPPILYLTHAGSDVQTDGALPYKDLHQAGRVFNYVCHKHTFVTRVRNEEAKKKKDKPKKSSSKKAKKFKKVKKSKGTKKIHTNSCEGWWQCVKRILRRLWGRQCSDDCKLSLRVQLASLLANMKRDKFSAVAGLLHAFRWWSCRPTGAGVDEGFTTLIETAREMFVVSPSTKKKLGLLQRSRAEIHMDGLAFNPPSTK